jgi:prepilin-type N-terminal cleavage/methylation domain-containing protein
MKRGDKGFTFIELIIALSIMALAGGAAALATFQVFKGTELSNTRMKVVHQVQNAGYWISRDAQKAQSVTTGNLTPPDFLLISWTDWDNPDDPIYHTATYFFEDLTDGIGKLKRSHWSSAGANEQTLIAEHLYYDPDDPEKTCKTSYQTPMLTVQLTAVHKDDRETREYKIKHRPNL